MNNLICQAIREKQVIKFTYDGYERVVEPHAYGVHKDTGNEVLCAYQIDGYSSSGKQPYWRLYDVSKMANVQLTDQKIAQPRVGYKLNDSRMSQIFCQLEI